jgi:hypothetical protein
MTEVILTYDQLKHLERSFGSSVWQMGPWNSDGIFGYSSIPLSAVEKAAEALDNLTLIVAVSRLRNSSAPIEAFSELLEVYGVVLIEKIADAYRQYSVDLMTGNFPEPQLHGRDRSSLCDDRAAARQSTSSWNQPLGGVEGDNRGSAQNDDKYITGLKVNRVASEHGFATQTE